MLHHKLIAGEIPGTYLVTELINEEDLLTIANQIARQKQAKGEAITDKHLAQQALQTLLQSREHEVFAMLFWTTNTGCLRLKSCSTVHSAVPRFIQGKSSNARWHSMQRR